MDPNRDWWDYVQGANAIALTWYNTVAGNQYYQPHTGVQVTTPGGVFGATASPIVWLILIGIAIYLIVK